MRLLLFIIIVTYLGFCFQKAHGENLVRVKVLVAQPAQVEREYVEKVVEYVRWLYRMAMGIRIRARIRDSSIVLHSEYILLSQRYDEFEAYDALLSNRKRWIKIVLVPAWHDENGIDYTAGFAKEQHSIAIATIRQFGFDGSDKFWHDWLVIAHELAHCLEADHRSKRPNIMHEAAGQFAGQELKFLWKTMRQILTFLEESEWER